MRTSFRTIPKVEKVTVSFLMLFVAGALSIFGRSPFLPSINGTSSGAPELRGERVFVRERCFYCHQLQDASAVEGTASRLWRYTYRDWLISGWARGGPDLILEVGKRTDDWQLAHLLNPQAVVGWSTMPAFSHLSDDELKSLIAFLSFLQKVGTQAPLIQQVSIPVVSQNLQTYQAGRKVYRRNCAGCHGQEGNGNGSVGHLLTPEPRDFTNIAWVSKQTHEYLFSIITYGKPQTAMPPYEDLLSSFDRALVLNYITYYAEPAGRQRMEEEVAEKVASP